MTLEEVFERMGFVGSHEDQCRQYARILDERENNIFIADELLGDQKSKNGLCIWDRKKAFINKYKHGVKFETISRAFEVPPPSGCELFNSEANSNSREGEEVYLRVAPFRYIAIVVKVEGSLIRIISARKTSAKVRKSSVAPEYATMSEKLFSSFIKAHDGEGGFTNSPDENVLFWASICCSFKDGNMSPEDAFFLLTLGLDLTEKHAEDFIEDWNIERGGKHLNKMMRW